VCAEESAIPKHHQGHCVSGVHRAQPLETRQHELAANSLSLPLPFHCQPVEVSASRLRRRCRATNGHVAMPRNQVLARVVVRTHRTFEIDLNLSDQLTILITRRANFDLHRLPGPRDYSYVQGGLY